MGETSYLDNLTDRHSLDLSETEEELSMVVRECNPTGMHHAISRKDMEVMQSIVGAVSCQDRRRDSDCGADQHNTFPLLIEGALTAEPSSVIPDITIQTCRFYETRLQLICTATMQGRN
jgi:hypothetical protein